MYSFVDFITALMISIVFTTMSHVFLNFGSVWLLGTNF
jgi:hypothetical protein